MPPSGPGGQDGIGKQLSEASPMIVEWKPLDALPDLRRVGIISLDTETNDGGLRANRGSGWPWKNGNIVGISVAYRADGTRWSQAVDATLYLRRKRWSG
jgi:hypothetical protein